METTPNIFDVYKSMLGTTAMSVTTDGFVRMEIDEGEYLPVTGKDGNPVVLPLPERLRDPNVGKTEVFHLLSENSKVANTSDLLTRYRHWLINRFNLVVGGLGGMLLGIAADEALSKSLRPDQQDFLSLVVEADATAVDNFRKIADAAAKPNQIQRVFMSMYLRNAAVNKLDKKSYNRVATVTFPFFEELVKLQEAEAEAKKTPKGQKKPKVDKVVFDVALRGKDIPTFVGLMHYLVPSLDTPHAYDLGSNSKIAPSIDALMRAFYPMAKHINEIIAVFKGISPAHDRGLAEMEFDLDWMDAFENLDAMWPQIRMTPTQNQGVIEEPTATAPTAAHAAAAAAQTPPWGPQPTPQPMPQPVPAPMGYGAMPAPAARPASSGGGGTSVSEMMAQARGMRPMPGPQQGYGGYPMQPPMGAYPGQPYPGQPYPQPGYPQAQPQGYPVYQTGPRHTY